MPTITRLNVKSDVLNFLNPRIDSIIGHLVMPLTTTTAGGTASLNDTVLGRGTVDADDFNRRGVEIVETVASGPADGEAATVVDAGFDTIDTLTFTPSMTLIVQTGTDYLLYPPELSAEMLNHNINAVLINTEAPYLWFPSMVDDAMFEENDLANWAALGTPATREFVTTAANTLLGERALHIIADATSEGATSNNIPVTEQESLLLSVTVRATVSDMIVQLYDVTNGAVIGDAVTIDEQAWTEIRIRRTVPDNCEEVSVRFLSGSTDSDFIVSMPVLLQSLWSHLYPGPSWLTRREQVVEALALPGGYGSEDNESFGAFSRRMVAVRTPTVLRGDRFVNQLQFEFANGGNRPVGLVCQRVFDALTANSGTTRCDRQYLMWQVIANIARRRNDSDWRGFKRTAMRRASDIGYGLREHLLVENETVFV